MWISLNLTLFYLYLTFPLHWREIAHQLYEQLSEYRQNVQHAWSYLWVVRAAGLSYDDQARSTGVVERDALQSIHQAVGARSCHWFRPLAATSGGIIWIHDQQRDQTFFILKKFKNTYCAPTWLCVRCRHYIFLCADWGQQRTPPRHRSGAPGRLALLWHGRTASCSHQLHTWWSQTGDRKIKQSLKKKLVAIH